VGVSLAVAAIAAVVLVTTWQSPSLGEATAQNSRLAKQTAPVAGSDAASMFKRAFHFWTLGDYSESFTWFKSAANKEHREARYYLALSYRDGLGTVQNYRDAFEQMQIAAHQGHLQAQYELGGMYRDGLGVSASREAAYAWWNIASSRGHEAATLERSKFASIMSSQQLMQAQDLTMKELAAIKTPAAADTPGAANTKIKQTP